MKKKYEIALSYAHDDIGIAKILKEELENVFADGFFMDEIRPEELTNASEFEKQLADIFQRSNYAVVLYSEIYKNRTFSSKEWEIIQDKAKQEKDPHFFIINMEEEKEGQNEWLPFTYNRLDKKQNQEDQKDLKYIHSQIYEIVHNRIKKFMIQQTVAEKKKPEEYSLNVQTVFSNGNIAKWNMDYDWNLLGSAYIDTDTDERGRRIRKDTTWEKFWQYIEKDFLWIKESLSQQPGTICRIHLNCHLSIAYKLGQIYGDLGQASGNRNLVLLSSNRFKSTEFSLEKEVNYHIPEDFCQEYKGNNTKSTDIVCIISIKPRKQETILETVKYFLEEQGQEYGKLCLFQKEILLEDANTLESMAEYLRERMKKCRIGNKCKIHLFPDTTAPLMFALGARTIFPGEVQLYEYYPIEDSYEKSLTKS